MSILVLKHLTILTNLLISDLNTGWTSKEELFQKLTHEDVDSYLINSQQRTEDPEKMQCYRQFIRGYNFLKENYIHD